MNRIKKLMIVLMLLITQGTILNFITQQNRENLKFHLWGDMEIPMLLHLFTIIWQTILKDNDSNNIVQQKYFTKRTRRN
jgi:hypothetical protein